MTTYFLVSLGSTSKIPPTADRNKNKAVHFYSRKTPEEIKILRTGGQILAAILEKLKDAIAPGVKTKELDSLAEGLITKAGGKPSFKGYKIKGVRPRYPASICISINDEVVHGLPSLRVIREGDIVGLDIGMEYKELFTDMAETIIVGEGDAKGRELVEVTRNALGIAISKVHVGGRVGDIGEAVQRYVESKGFGVVRQLVGHGVGYKVHEEPEIPNWGKAGEGPELRENMVIAIEPMVTEGSPELYLASDQWTWKTKDARRAAHFEHTMAVTREGAEVLTGR